MVSLGARVSSILTKWLYSQSFSALIYRMWTKCYQNWKKAVVLLNLGKCCFFTKNLKYLGEIVRLGALAIDDAQIENFNRLRNALNVTKTRFSLRWCNLYWRFVTRCTCIAASLAKFICNGQPKPSATFDNHKNQAFSNLIKAILRPDFLFAIDTAKNCKTFCWNSRGMQLYPATAPLEFVAMDILGQALTTKRKNRLFLVITERFSKRIKTVILCSITAGTITNPFFLESWVFVHGTPWLLFFENGLKFRTKHLQHVCQMLGVKNLLTSTYHPQFIRPVKRINETIVEASQHYNT